VATILVIVIHCAPWPSQASSSAASLYSGLSLISRVSPALGILWTSVWEHEAFHKEVFG
jgi:hypothetical protein